VRNADVLVTNLRPRSRQKLGITYERLSENNPGLILCTAQAYGSETAFRDYPAYDDIVQAASGAAKLAELIDGEPRYAQYVIADKVVGLSADRVHALADASVVTATSPQATSS
jgi:crotonobetainyl-CoA:carnitine CoA-transferase CaiB-like acyl-CoA transferase